MLSPHRSNSHLRDVGIQSLSELARSHIGKCEKIKKDLFGHVIRPLLHSGSKNCSSRRERIFVSGTFKTSRMECLTVFKNQGSWGQHQLLIKFLFQVFFVFTKLPNTFDIKVFFSNNSIDSGPVSIEEIPSRMNIKET